MFTIQRFLRHLTKYQQLQQQQKHEIYMSLRRCYYKKEETTSKLQRETTSSSATTNKASSKKRLHQLTADVILSEENRKRCIDCLLQSPPIGVTLKKKESFGAEQALAAVLIALCTDEKNAISLLYTRRSSNLSRHMRQISFPGGLKDATDENFVDCALRETEEEIGLTRGHIKIWGTGNLITPPNTAAIMPVVGVVENFNIKDLHINHHEVEEVFTVPLSSLADPMNLHYTQFRSGYSSPLFLTEKYRIWGVTGFLTNSFLNCLLPEHLNQLKNRVHYIRPFRVQKKN